VQQQGTPLQSSKMLYLEKKETERVSRRLRKQVEESEIKIAAVEGEIAAMDARLASGDAGIVNDTAFYSTYEEKKQALESLMHQWEKANSELEHFLTEYTNNDDNI